MIELAHISLSVPNPKGNELAYVAQAVKTEWVSTANTYVRDLEKSVESYVGTPVARWPVRMVP